MKRKWIVRLILFVIFMLGMSFNVLAADNQMSTTVTIKDNKDVLVTKEGICVGNDWKITVKNDTGSKVLIKVTKSDKVTLADTKPSYIKETSLKYTDTKFELEVGQSKDICIYVDKETGKNSNTFTTTVTFSTTIYKSYTNISNDSDKPIKLKAGQQAIGPVYSKEKPGYFYYEFTLKEASTVTGKFDSPVGMLEFFNNIITNGEQKYIKPGKNFTWKLPERTYLIGVDHRGIGESYLGDEYKFTLNVKKFNWGSIKLKWKDSKLVEGKSNKLTVSLTGSEKGEGVAMEHIWVNGKQILAFDKKTSISNTVKPIAGDNKIRVTLRSESYGEVTKDIYVAAIPKKPILEKKALYVKSKSLTFYPGGKGDRYVKVQQKKGSSWKTIKDVKDSTKTINITGLKPDTKYTYRLITYVPKSKTKTKKQLTSPASKSLTIETGTTKKPAIKSIKATGKVYYQKKEYHPGHWTAGHWIDGSYTGGYYYTVVKVKVTLKKKIPKIKGIFINGTPCKGTGTTFTMSYTQIGGGKKGAIGIKTKYKVISYKDATYGGDGPSVTKTVKITK